MVTLFKGKMYRAKFVELGMKKFQLQHGSIPVGIAFVGILESYFSPYNIIYIRRKIGHENRLNPRSCGDRG